MTIPNLWAQSMLRLDLTGIAHRHPITGKPRTFLTLRLPSNEEITVEMDTDEYKKLVVPLLNERVRKAARE